MNQAAQRLMLSPSGQLWYVPKDLFRFPELKPPHKLLFLAIWNRGEARPGKQSLTTAGAADAIREDERRVREWLWGGRGVSHSLVGEGLIEIIRREKKGALIVNVRDPAIVAEEHEAAGRILKPDPQLVLFDFTPEFGAGIRPLSMEPKKALNLHGAIDHSSMESMEGKGMGSDTPDSGRNPASESGVSPDELAFHAEVSLRRRELERSPTERTVEETLLNVANAFERATDPSRKKGLLVAQIVERVRDPHMHPSIPGRAADHVVNGDVALSELNTALRLIEQIRDAESRGTGQGFTAAPGALFVSLLRKWPCWEKQSS
jgi:hypothetical protein